MLNVKLLIIRGIWGTPRSHCSLADDKAPGDLIPQMQLLNLQEKKSQHDFIDNCSLSSKNGIRMEIKVKGQKLGTVPSFKYLGGVVSHNGST